LKVCPAESNAISMRMVQHITQHNSFELMHRTCN